MAAPPCSDNAVKYLRSTSVRLLKVGRYTRSCITVSVTRIDSVAAVALISGVWRA